MFLHCSGLTRTGCLQDASSTYEDSIENKIQHRSWLQQHWFTTAPLTRILVFPQRNGATTTSYLQDAFSTYEESVNKNNKEAHYSSVGSPLQAVLKSHCSYTVAVQPAVAYRMLPAPGRVPTTTNTDSWIQEARLMHYITPQSNLITLLLHCDGAASSRYHQNKAQQEKHPQDFSNSSNNPPTIHLSVITIFT